MLQKTYEKVVKSMDMVAGLSPDEHHWRIVHLSGGGFVVCNECKMDLLGRVELEFWGLIMCFGEA